MAQQTAYPLRIDTDLKEWLRNRAEKNDRSINAEIINILKKERDKDNKE